MKSVRLIVLSVLILQLAACSKEEKTTKANKAEVPAALTFEKPVQGPRLTKDQIESMKAFFAGKSVMMLPPGELIFPNKNTDPASIASKEQELSRTDSNSYSLLQEIRGGCAKDRPTVNFDATFPLDGFSLDNMKAGDHGTYSMSAGLAGTNCPIPFSAGTGSSMAVEEADANQKSLKISAGTSGKIQAMVTNPRYSKLLNSRGIIMDSRLSGLGTTTELKSGSMLITFSMSGSYLSLTSELPYSMNVQYLVKGSKGNSTSAEAVGTTTFQFPDFTVRIDMHTTGISDVGGSAVSEVYVNGHLMTEKEASDLFGSSNPATQMKSNQVLKNLL